MIELIKNHYFWKYSIGRFSIFNKPVDNLYNDIQTIIKFTYVFFIFLIFVTVFNTSSVETAQRINPLWPLEFFDAIPSAYCLLFLKISLLVSFVLLCFKTNNLFLRVYAFVSFFLFVAFMNSFGKINHGLYLPLMLLFCFIFLPSKKSENYKEKTILIFATAQLFLLLSYTLTGFWKVFWGVIELFNGQVSIFSTLSLRNVIILQNQLIEPTLVGSWLIENYVFGWVLYWVVIYIELFSIVVFFRANLHKIWGILLLFLHAGISLLLDVTMYAAPMCIGLLLILSPFNQNTDFKQTIRSLPVIKTLYKGVLLIKNRL